MRHARHVRTVSVALACIALAACAGSLDPAGALTVLPYRLESGGRILVDVRLDGQGPFRFAVDTAATGSFVFAGTQQALGLRPEPGITVTVHGAVASGRFPVVGVDRLEIGAVVWDAPQLIALPADVPPADRIDGVLGTDFLRRYALGFAVEEQLLQLFPPDYLPAAAYAGWESVSLRPERFGESQESLHFLEIRIGQGSVPALFDLGAGISVLNPPAARALRLAPTRRDRAGEFAGALGRQTLIAQLGTQALRTGAVRWRDESFLIGDLPIFGILDHADRPLAILGSGVFSQRDFIIDFAHERLLVRASMSEQTVPAVADGSNVVSSRQPRP